MGEIGGKINVGDEAGFLYMISVKSMEMKRTRNLSLWFGTVSEDT